MHSPAQILYSDRRVLENSILSNATLEDLLNDEKNPVGIHVGRLRSKVRLVGGYLFLRYLAQSVVPEDLIKFSDNGCGLKKRFLAYVFTFREASVRIKDPQTNKKREMPGYSLAITQAIAFGGDQRHSQTVFEEPFRMDDLRKAVDAFQQQVLSVQTWAEIAESRARVMPNQNDVFECFHCGWVTDIWSDEIVCEGCGRRYRSERLSKEIRDTPRPLRRFLLWIEVEGFHVLWNKSIEKLPAGGFAMVPESITA